MKPKFPIFAKLLALASLAFVIFAILAIALLPWVHAKALKAFSGDGRIKDLSVWTPSGYARRYRVEFDQFPLNRKFEKTYHVKGLPKILWSPARVNLRVHVDPDRFQAPDLHAKIAVTVSKVTKPIIQFEGEVSKMRAEEWSNAPETAEFYDENSGNAFSPNPSEKYQIDVLYMADTSIDGLGEFVIDTSGP